MTEPPGTTDQARPDERTRREERSRRDLDRVLLFSDAVFAIAMTLLAIDLRLPPGNYTDQDLPQALSAMAPEIGAFILSFMVVALFWMGHYRTFRMTVRVEPRVVTLNFAFLALVALLPFPTSVLAHDGNLGTANAFYGLFVLVTALLSSALWIVSLRLGLMAPEITPQIGRAVAIRALAVPAVFAVSIPIAFVNPTAAEILWFGSLFVQAALTRRFHLDIGPGAPQPRG